MIPEATRTSVCLWLSKSGGLSAHAEELRRLAASLPPAEVADFYCFLRDHSQRWESEWRREFSAIFSVPDAALPQVDDADRWSSILHTLVALGDLPRIRAFIEGIGLPGWRISPEPTERDFSIYPIDAKDPEGELPTQKARRLDYPEVAAYLEEQKSTVASRYRADWNEAYAKKS